MSVSWLEQNALSFSESQIFRVTLFNDLSISTAEISAGFTAAWDSEHDDVGRGKQESMAIDEGKQLDFELRFLSPFEVTEPVFMTTPAQGKDKTLLNWGFHGPMDYSINLLFLYGFCGHNCKSFYHKAWTPSSKYWSLNNLCMNAF
ncbi:hypothetical protein [Shewanella gelidii]|uniref:Uncharacterized protein n=1 Tax=Shewanella gelidii TaxID=1642821 RepID=A0A917JWA4_9GAMM|nr:hypothetical protein [Shewanella gelidii]MCL1098801.1 hypothetical protein [Shewanella gelidii]GGI87568.1 hypothetical protein GCM10009332_26060 [Shewanella gelidii]